MNMIDAIVNLVNNPITKIVSTYKNKNRAKGAGDALEEYIKDLFANSFSLDERKRNKKWNELPSKDLHVYVPLLQAFMDEKKEQYSRF